MKRGFLLPDGRAAIELGLLLIILIVAGVLRWHGLAWDSGYLFHPDERQIVLVVSKLQLPSNPLDLYSASSPLNPHFFAYGSFPIYLFRLLAPFAPPTDIVGPWSDSTIARWVLFGRALSGLFDLGTIVLTYMLGRRAYEARVGLIASACVGVTVLHIQLSHFYTVDTLLTFFVMLTLYSAFRVAQTTILFKSDPTRSLPCVRRGEKWLVFCGIGFGLALATKISALLLFVPIAYACYRASGVMLRGKSIRDTARTIWRAIRRPLLQIAGVALLVFVITQPYAILDAVTFVNDVGREALVARGWLDYPYTRQYAATLPFVYPIVQSAIWAMGLPLGILAWGGGALFVYGWWRTREWRDLFMLSWALVYFLTIGAQYAKYLRYLLPLLPVLYLIAARAWLQVFRTRQIVGGFLYGGILLTSLLYAIAFVRMYDGEHPWLTASRWIYENVPRGSTLVIEQWDDALPTLIPFPDGTRRSGEYKQITLELYEPDNDDKRAQIANALADANIVVLASQRVYGSIGRLPTRYPMTNRYYEKLFNGELGFEPVITARIAPNLFGIAIRYDPLVGLAIDTSGMRHWMEQQLYCCSDYSVIWDWGFADESYSVYDHPVPIIFRKTQSLTFSEIYSLLGPP